jgi:adenylylsulfate kinase
MIKEIKARSILKSITWRICATLTTFTIVGIVFKKWDVAAMVGGLEAFFKMGIYFIHERVWVKVKFGKREVQPFVVWFTGLSGSGKTELAEHVTAQLQHIGFKVDHLDGKNIRKLIPDTDYTRDHVNDHIMRIGLLASRLEDKGVLVVASFLSPYRESRQFVRDICANFIEVHVATSLAYCESKDENGLYAKARKGEIRNLPGVDVQYEAPENADIVVDLGEQTMQHAADQVIRYLKRYI